PHPQAFGGLTEPLLVTGHQDQSETVGGQAAGEGGADAGGGAGDQCGRHAETLTRVRGAPSRRWLLWKCCSCRGGNPKAKGKNQRPFGKPLGLGAVSEPSARLLRRKGENREVWT